MTSISKLGRPYENGKALDVSTRRLVITDLIDGMSAKAVGKKCKLGTKVVTKIKYRYEQDGTVFLLRFSLPLFFVFPKGP